MIICLHGQPGSGKTTLSKEIIAKGEHILRYSKLRGFFPIDGDKLREITNNDTYNRAGRLSNVETAINIALYAISNEYLPIISMVMPYAEMRMELDFRSKCPIFFFELFYNQNIIRNKEHLWVEDYEKNSDAVKIDTTNNEVETSMLILTGHIFSKIIS